jgi:tol-pal system protein YbgF
MRAGLLYVSILIAGSLLLRPDGAHAQLFGESQESRAIRAQSAQIGELKARIDALTARLERAEATIRGQLELQLRVDQLVQEIARLRGTLEEQANELATTQRRQIDLQSTLEARLARLEPMTVEIGGRTAKVDPAERRRFEAASALFASRDFRSAQLALAGFIVDYPDSPYLPQALFEIGSSQFLQKDYKQAVENLLALVARFPDNPRMPEVLLTLGYAQIELGDRRTARRTLEHLVEKFPDSPVTGAAKERLATLPAAGR